MPQMSSYSPSAVVMNCTYLRGIILSNFRTPKDTHRTKLKPVLAQLEDLMHFVNWDGKSYKRYQMKEKTGKCCFKWAIDWKPTKQEKAMMIDLELPLKLGRPDWSLAICRSLCEQYWHDFIPEEDFTYNDVKTWYTRCEFDGSEYLSTLRQTFDDHFAVTLNSSDPGMRQLLIWVIRAKGDLTI